MERTSIITGLVPVKTSRFLSDPWPPDLNRVTVPFRTRSVTVLTRQGYFDDPTLFDTLTEA